jgi:hypothetical protein
MIHMQKIRALICLVALLSLAAAFGIVSRAWAAEMSPSTHVSSELALEEARKTAETFLSLLKEKRFDDSQKLLTDWYEYEKDSLFSDVYHSSFNKKNFDTFIDMTKFVITDEKFSGDKFKMTVEAARPDVLKIDQSDNISRWRSSDHKASEYHKFIADTLKSKDCPMTTYSKTLTLKRVNEEWRITLDRDLLDIISLKQQTWLAPETLPSVAAYIAENISLTADKEEIAIINGGSKNVLSLTAKLEYIDKSGNIKMGKYRSFFVQSNLSDFAPALARSLHPEGNYIMRPGYMRTETKERFFSRDDLKKYGAVLDKCKVYVVDATLEDSSSWPALPPEAQKFCDEFIAVGAHKIEAATSEDWWSGNGITKLKISNKSEKTVTRLTLLLEFQTGDGVARASSVFRIIYPDADDKTDRQIPPKGAWTLRSRAFFPLYQIPSRLAKLNKVSWKVLEIEY